MTDAIRRIILPHDVGPEGNVTVWDHGPSRPAENIARDSAEYKAREVEARKWFEQYGRVPQPILMHVQDAAQALVADPRYAMEPDGIDDAEVDAEVKSIQAQRAEAAKVAADRAIAAQLVIDRKAAIATVMTARAAKAAEDAKAPAPARRPILHPPGSPTSQQLSPLDIELERRAAYHRDHPDEIGEDELGRRAAWDRDNRTPYTPELPNLPRLNGESDEDYSRRNEENKARMLRDAAHE
jgi:hypothetical protein